MAFSKAVLFTKIGKEFDDLWKKKYDFKNQLKVTSAAAPWTVTSTATVDNGVTGNVVTKYADKGVEGEVEVDTKSSKSYAKLTHGKLVDKTKLTFGAGFDPKTAVGKDSWSVKAEAEREDETISAQLSLQVGDETKDHKDHIVLGTEVVGSLSYQSGGVTVGAQVKGKLDDPALTDYNFGVQYSQGPFTFHFLSEKEAEVLKVGAFHKKESCAFGVEYISDEGNKLSKPADPQPRILNLATEFAKNGTNYKLRLSTTGDAAAVVERSFDSAKVSLSSSWKVKGTSSIKHDKLGVAISY